MQTMNAVKMAHHILLDKLATAKCVVDATAGNGNDTLFLARNTCDQAVVWAFDIQEAALVKTERLLLANSLSGKVRLILDSHANIGKYIDDSIDVAMFNLGYLPGYGHEITTQPYFTLIALQQILNRLSVGGLVSLVAYPGHSTGYDEHIELQKVFCEMPQNVYTVGCWSMVNHVKCPPVLYVIEKVRSEAREGSASR